MKTAKSLLALPLLFLGLLLASPHPMLAVDASPVQKHATDGTGFELKDRFNELYRGQVTLKTITYASTVNVDFSAGGLQTCTLTGNVTITVSNIVAGQTVVLRVIGSGGSRNFTALPAFVFVGAAAPTAVASGKTGVFVLRSFGTTAASVVARYEVQP